MLKVLEITKLISLRLLLICSNGILIFKGLWCDYDVLSDRFTYQCAVQKGQTYQIHNSVEFNDDPTAVSIL